MCDDSGTAAEAFASTPREAAGTAVDPIALAPVDEITITTLVDNSYDALMGDTGPARRTAMGGCRRWRHSSSRGAAPRRA